MDSITHHEQDKPKKWLLTPNQISMGGKLLGIILAIGAGTLSIFTSLEIDLDAINKTAWTLAFLGAPVDASIIFGNLGNAFRKH